MNATMTEAQGESLKARLLRSLDRAFESKGTERTLLISLPMAPVVAPVRVRREQDGVWRATL